jgi:hypothetical protein
MRSRRRRCLAFCVTIAGYLRVGLGHAGGSAAPATDFQLRISGDVKRPLTLNAADYRALIWLGMGPVNLKRLCDTCQCDKSADAIHSQLQYRWGYDKLLAVGQSRVRVRADPSEFSASIALTPILPSMFHLMPLPALENRRHPLAPAHTHGLQPVAGVTPLHFV